LDATLKSKIAEQKTARGRVSFKNVEEVDRQIKRLEEQVDTGTMKLVDEKKALAEITGLRKQRKQFAGFDDSQKEIDDIKAKISELKKEREHPEEKASRDRYSEIQKELDSIKAEHDETYKNLNALRDERTRIHGVQQEKYIAIRTLKDKYFKAKREFKDYEDAAWKARKERQKAERDAFEKEKRRKIADRKMEEARNPAYTDEILTAEGLIRYFDPSAAVSNTTTEPGKFAAQAQRTVDDSGIKGTRRLKKDEQEDNYFVGTGGKKGKKGKKQPTANSPTSSAPTEGGKFNLSIGVIEELAKVGVEPPMNQSDVPSVVEKLKEKLESWKKDQKSKTEEVSHEPV
jgi:chromosome segregation ATPase